MEHLSLSIILLFFTFFLGKRLAKFEARNVSNLIVVPTAITCLITLGLSLYHFNQFIEITLSYEINQLLTTVILFSSVVLIMLYGNQVEKEKKIYKEEQER